MPLIRPSLVVSYKCQATVIRTMVKVFYYWKKF